MTESQAHADPLLPRFWARFRRLRSSSAFPHLVMGVALFGLAIWFGGRPNVTFGFVDTFNEPGTPIPSSSVPVTTTTTPESTPSTELGISAADLASVVTEAGFPELEVSLDGATVTVGGSVPDQASRNVVIRELQLVEGVEDVVDELAIEALPSAAGVRMVVGGRSVMVTGRVPNQETVSQLLGLLESAFRPEQIDIGELEVDETAGPLGSLAVTGTITDEALAARLTELFESLSSVQAQVDINLAERPRIEVLVDELLALTPIEFETGEATITPAGADVLDEVAQILDQFPAASIEVGGHTDSQGSDEDNADLSRDRALVVIAELRDRGVENDLEAVGYGELRPRVDPERTAADRAANRRIEFRLF